MNIAVETSVTHYPFGHVICEDLGLTMGYAFAELWRQQAAEGVNGDGEAIGIIDEGMARTVVSFEDRAQFHFSSAVKIPEHVEDMLSTDLNQFFDGFAQGARCTIHIRRPERRRSTPHLGKRLPRLRQKPRTGLCPESPGVKGRHLG